MITDAPLAGTVFLAASGWRKCSRSLIQFAVAITVFAGLAQAEEMSGRASVVDGDTIHIEGVHKNVRMFGVDAPESGQICVDGGGKRFLCGVRAAAELATIIGQNGRVACEEKDRDRYGRPVAVCRIGGRDLAGEMIRRGWAVDFVRYSRGRYEAEQDAAQRAGAGLWAGDFDVPWEWRAKRKVSTQR